MRKLKLQVQMFIDGFIPHWAKVAANPDGPEFSSGKKFTNTHKVVFTKTLGLSKWLNTVLAKGGIVVNKYRKVA